MPQNALNILVSKFLSGAFSPLVLGKQSDLLMSQLHGEKYQQNYLGKLNHGANPTGVTTSAGLAATYVGCCLSNPAASGKNLIPRSISGQFIVAPATVTALGLIGGFAAGGITVHTTPLTPLNGVIGNTYAGVGLLDSACTLVGTPAWMQWEAETLIATDLPFFSIDLYGSIIIPPGGYLAIGSSIAGPAAGFVGSFEWEEETP